MSVDTKIITASESYRSQRTGALRWLHSVSATKVALVLQEEFILVGVNEAYTEWHDVPTVIDRPDEIPA